MNLIMNGMARKIFCDENIEIYNLQLRRKEH